MSGKEVTKLIIIALIVFILSHLQYLPGPTNNLLYTFSFLMHALIGALTIASIFVLPVSVVVYFVFRKRKPAIAKWAIFSTVIFASSLLSIVLGGYVTKNYAQAIAADNAEPMIRDIENYKLEYGEYPEANNKMYPTGIIGIEPYTYHKYKNGYKLSFRLCITIGLNWDYLTYDPTGNTESTDNIADVVITDRKNWYQHLGK